MTIDHRDFPRRHLFDLAKGLIYLDGNSLGPPVKGSEDIAYSVIDSEWKKELISAWNTCGWIELPHTVGNLLAPIIGVSLDTISMGDTLSVKLFQVLAAAVEMRPKRKVVLTDSGNFPSDLYIANGLLDTLGRGHQLKITKPDQVIKKINDEVAVVCLTHVDYRTGRKHDMAEITTRAHECGSVVIWDLAHSAGALPLELETIQAEFAVGCTYKYLNGGPGAPAFVYVRPDLVSSIQPVMPGWLGHKKPFSMDIRYTPAKGVGRFRIGTPSVIQFKILEVSNIKKNEPTRP
ncbi:MAG: aminotransferase class V-fold PLP-dependent enzyme [Gammaproteobacteria bacterium]|nr:aminotransferase class V-fold PLP-dependent enzyme [Gammaproteobacteria bacterium]